MDACIIECTTLHKLIQAFFSGGWHRRARIEDSCSFACLESISYTRIVALCICYFKWSN